MGKELIIDFETLGTNVHKHCVVDLSFLFFDRDRFLNDPYDFETLISLGQKVKFSVKEQIKKYGYEKDDETIKIIKEWPLNVRMNFLPNENDLTLYEGLNIFMNEVEKQKKIDFWWSRSNTFDPVILERIISNFPLLERKFKSYLKYWRVRDTRTYIDAMTNFDLKMKSFIPIKDTEYWNRTFEQHNSIHDIAADILRMQALTRGELL